MVVYEVSVTVEPALVEPFEQYMRRKHIPEILATGCFTRIRFERATGTRYRTSYEAETQGDVDRYLTEHTARLREDFLATFPAGATASREIWTSLQSWTA